MWLPGHNDVLTPFLSSIFHFLKLCCPFSGPRFSNYCKQHTCVAAVADDVAVQPGALQQVKITHHNNNTGKRTHNNRLFMFIL